MERREFLKQAALGTAALASTAASALRISGANDRVNLGLVGAGGRGRLLMKLAAAIPNVEFTAVSDLYPPAGKRGAAIGRARLPSFQEFPKAPGTKDVDAVLIATPEKSSEPEPWSGRIPGNESLNIPARPWSS